MISLQQVIDAVEQADDSASMFYDTVTGETVVQFDRWVSGIVDEELENLCIFFGHYIHKDHAKKMSSV